MKTVFSYCLILLFFIPIKISAQHKILGNFPAMAGQTVKLVAYKNFGTESIDSTKTDNKGKFTLSFPKKTVGMAYLTTEDHRVFIVVLDGEDIELEGESLDNPQEVNITKSEQNKLFARYASQHPRREQTYSAWDFLEKIYQKDSLFMFRYDAKLAIEKEKKRIEQEDEAFLKNLPSNSYLSYYLPLRKLVSQVRTIAQYRSAEIPKSIASFRKIDYADERLYNSGILRESIENHFWLIENSGQNLATVYSEMKTSVDMLLQRLAKDEEKLNMVATALLKLLEERSLYDVAEHLSLKLLNNKQYKIQAELEKQLERYRSMKVGQKAPDFSLKADVYSASIPKKNIPKSLYDIQSKNTLVIFGSSWCTACLPDLLHIASNYPQWKALGMEVVFVSLDENKTVFRNFVQPFPFISFSDFKKWESPVAKAYFVNSTPSFFLLNDKKEIILRPNTIEHLETWIEWYLVAGSR